jgi:hypothetical protein
MVVELDPFVWNDYPCLISLKSKLGILSQPYVEKGVKMRLTFPKWGLGSPLGLSELQSSIIGVKTPRIETFFISSKSYRSVDVENELVWAIGTSVGRVIAKRKVGSQICNLTPDHQKSRIDSTPMRASGVRHTVGKLLTRATRLLQTSSQSEVWTKSYDLAKWRESKSGQFQDSSSGVSR